MAHDIQVAEHDVTQGTRVTERMVRRFGRVATPAIIIGERVFWGFEENRVDIADLLGIDESPASEAAGAEPQEVERVTYGGEIEGDERSNRADGT